MSYKDYKVYCFKGVDYIATKVKDMQVIIDFYTRMFEDDLDISEIKEVLDRDSEFTLINEETNFKERTTYNKLIKEYIEVTDDADFLYLCSTEW